MMGFLIVCFLQLGITIVQPRRQYRFHERAAPILLPKSRWRIRLMADKRNDDQRKPSEKSGRGEERDSERKSPPHVTAEEVKEDAEAEDRFEASDN
jgi:hypothetical protein